MLGGVTTLSGLKDKAGTLTLGAPPEFQTRPQGIPGLEDLWRCLQDYVPLKGQALVQALRTVRSGGQHLLDRSRHRGERLRDDRDDKKLFGSQNVVPLVAADRAGEVTAALDAVSAKLTTQG